MEVFDVEFLGERLACSLPQLLNLQLANLKRDFTESLILFVVCLLQQELRCAITDPPRKTRSEIFTQPTPQGQNSRSKSLQHDRCKSGQLRQYTYKQTNTTLKCMQAFMLQHSCTSRCSNCTSTIAVQQLQFNNCSLTIAV